MCMRREVWIVYLRNVRNFDFFEVMFFLILFLGFAIGAQTRSTKPTNSNTHAHREDL
jgi:hypothetical protein